MYLKTIEEIERRIDEIERRIDLAEKNDEWNVADEMKDLLQWVKANC